MVHFDAKSCSACHACSVACIDENDLPRGEGQVCAYRKVTEREENTAEGYRFVRSMRGCMHCDNAPCIDACPMHCFSRDAQCGLVLPDNTACIGCGKCSAVCPFGAISFNAAGKMRKCDGCIDRVRSGLPPACEMICPPKALQFKNKRRTL